MQGSLERRKFKRLPIKLHLEISHMFRQDYKVLDNIDAEISVCDISKSGIGFFSAGELPLNYYFNAKICLDSENFFYAVLKIVREFQLEDQKEYFYGAEFVGLAPFLAAKVEAYEKSLYGNAMI